jgi:anaerobic ribonucleoside-triphosphate reductase
MVDESKQINIKTAQSQIDYDTRKLAKYFPDDMINQIVSNRNCNLQDYEKWLNLAYADYYKKNKMLTDNLVLKIPRVDIKDSLSEEQFSELLNIIAPYFRKSIKYVENNLPDSVGYLIYLMSTPTTNLSFEDKERYGLIKNMID